MLLIVINNCYVQYRNDQTLSHSLVHGLEYYFLSNLFFPTLLPVDFITLVPNFNFIFNQHITLSYYLCLVYFGPCSKLSNVPKIGHLSKLYNGSWGLVEHGAFFTQMLHNPVLHKYTFSQSLTITLLKMVY